MAAAAAAAASAAAPGVVDVETAASVGAGTAVSDRIF